MDWTEVKAGVINAAQQRFWLALGNSADAVANRMNSDAVFLDSVAKFAISGSVPIPTEAPKPAPTLIFIKETMLGSTRVVVYDLGDNLSFPQMCRPVVKLGDDVSVDEIERLLKARKHTFSEAKLDEILEKQKKFFLQHEGGEDFGLSADWWNFVLVEDEHGTVSVVDAHWRGGRWIRCRDSLDRVNVWRRGRRLVLSNSGASNL